MKRISFFLIILICFINNSYGQENFSKGFIVTHHMDTITGLLKNVSNGEMFYSVTFKDSFGNISVQTTNSIISYKIGNNYYYRKMMPSSYDYYYFFKLKIEGKIRLYEFTRPAEDIMSGIMRTSLTNSMTGINIAPNLQNQNTLTFIEKDNQFKIVDGKRFKSLVKKFVKDDPEILEKVLDKTYEESEIYILIRKYNENYKKRNQ